MPADGDVITGGGTESDAAIVSRALASPMLVIGVVNHVAPTAISLAADHIRRLACQGYGFPVLPRPFQRPFRHHQRQFTCWTTVRVSTVILPFNARNHFQG